jgi:flagellum-specific peptidoglycan hydrolase FlgJ
LGALKDALSIQLVGPFETFVNAITGGLDRMVRMFGRWGESSAAFGKSWSGVKRLFSGDIKGGLAEMAAGKQELADIMSGKTAAAPAKPATQIVPGQPQAQPSVQPSLGQPQSQPPAQPAVVAQASQSLEALKQQFKNIPAQVLEFAKAAADKLQVPITNILAQLRAEVGPKFEKFIGQYNYGNIKAGKGWKGETQERTVHEFDKQGNKYYVKDKFRAYKSAAEAGLDYANLLEKSYPKVAGAKSIEQFASGLQSGVGGRMYATDPKYQEKLAATERAIQKQNAVTLQQTNTYHISSPNPQAAASAVGAMHERTNADAVRNLGGVIR